MAGCVMTFDLSIRASGLCCGSGCCYRRNEPELVLGEAGWTTACSFGKQTKPPLCPAAAEGCFEVSVVVSHFKKVVRTPVCALPALCSMWFYGSSCSLSLSVCPFFLFFFPFFGKVCKVQTWSLSSLKCYCHTTLPGWAM